MKVRILSLHSSSLGACSGLRVLIHARGRTPASGCPVRASVTLKVTTASEPATSPRPPCSSAFAEKATRTPSFSIVPAAEVGAAFGAAAAALAGFGCVSCGPPICALAAEAQTASKTRARAHALSVGEKFRFINTPFVNRSDEMKG